MQPVAWLNVDMNLTGSKQPDTEMPTDQPPTSAGPPASQQMVDKLQVRTYASRQGLADAGCEDISAALRACLKSKDRVRMILAAAPSQTELLAQLASSPEIDWSRVTLFHMDEFIGLPEDSPRRFAAWLERHFFAKVPRAEVHRIVPEPTPEAAARHYADLLNEAEIDMICLGIGVNGHIAFNDPPVADFDDPLDVKVVELDRTCRLQQVDDQGFQSLDAVPTHAITLTVPRLLRAARLFCAVPGAHKAEAVRHCLNGEISTAWPASILRTHPDCTLYLDKDSDPNG